MRRRPARRREQIAREAEFYGAMDGAARFNQRDAMATILITAINIIAGFLIGVFQLDIPFREAFKTYTVLTVGDGLVTMIPSLLVSMAGGMVVTRASSDAGFSVDVGRQLLSRRPLISPPPSCCLWLRFLGCRNFLSLAGGLYGIPRVASSKTNSARPDRERG